MELVKFSYNKIASKLSSFVPQNQKVRVIVFCSCKDHGRDKVNLALVKHFGVLPEEYDTSKGDSAVNILSGLTGYDGLLIIIESVCINELLLKDTISRNEHSVSMSCISRNDQRLISGQTGKISNYFKKNQHEHTGGYVYISGFSALMPSTDQDSLPEAEFLPWYLEVNNKSSLWRIEKQPELGFLMQKMTEVKPLISNLDNYLDEMNGRESKLGN